MSFDLGTHTSRLRLFPQVDYPYACSPRYVVQFTRSTSPGLPCRWYSNTNGTAIPSLTSRGWRVGEKKKNFLASCTYSQLRPPRATAAQSGGAWAAPRRTGAGDSDTNTMVQWWRQALWNWCIICRGAAYITDFISFDVPRPLHHRHSVVIVQNHANVDPKNF